MFALKINLTIYKFPIFLLYSSFLSVAIVTLNVHCIDIDCKYKIKDYVIAGRMCVCDVTASSIEITNKNKEIEDIKAIGTIPNECLSKPPGFYVLSKKFHFFPKNFSPKLNDLNAIEIISSQLKEINHKNIENFSNLKVLDISNNDVVSIEFNLFIKNPKLMIVNFSMNKIKFFNPKIFDNLENLQQLTMIGHDFIDEYSENRIETIEMIQKLKSICLTYNFFEESEMKLTISIIINWILTFIIAIIVSMLLWLKFSKRYRKVKNDDNVQVVYNIPLDSRLHVDVNEYSEPVVSDKSQFVSSKNQMNINENIYDETGFFNRSKSVKIDEKINEYAEIDN